jgi:hypothetical protein
VVIDITFHFTRTDLEERGSTRTFSGGVAGAILDKGSFSRWKGEKGVREKYKRIPCFREGLDRKWM